MEGPIAHPLPRELLMIDLYLNMYTYIFICMYVWMYTYIFIYIHTEHMMFWSLLKTKWTEGQSAWELGAILLQDQLLGPTLVEAGSAPTYAMEYTHNYQLSRLHSQFNRASQIMFLKGEAHAILRMLHMAPAKGTKSAISSSPHNVHHSGMAPVALVEPSNPVIW